MTLNPEYIVDMGKILDLARPHPSKNPCEKLLEEIIEYIETIKKTVSDNKGEGSVGAIYGICDHLKGLRTAPENSP